MISKRFWVAVGVIVLTAGCAAVPTDPDALEIYRQNNDPLEPMNRAVFGFNEVADEYVLAPVVRGYRAVTPEPVRDGIDNFFTNLKQPVYLVNALLQGDMPAAGHISERFMVNTFLGFFGTIDTASAMDIPVVRRDFGQTLGVWGVQNSGPYLVLPILGPTTVREVVGLGADVFMDPVNWALYEQDDWLAYVRVAGNGLVQLDDTRDLLDNLKKNSTDYYASIRSTYQQNRQQEIKRLRGETDAAAYEFDFPDEDEE